MRTSKFRTLTQILAHTTKAGDCRIWKGHYNARGVPLVYSAEDHAKLNVGATKKRNTMRAVARIVWRLSHKQEVPAGYRVIASCGNKGCLKHLELKTLSEVMRQRFAEGAYNTTLKRMSCLLNSRKCAKLDDEKVAYIHANVKKRGDAVVVAKNLGVSPTLVRQVARRERWNSRLAPNASVFHMSA